MHRLSGKIVIASLGLVIAGLGTVWAINWLRPNLTDRRPNLVDVPSLVPVSRSSRIVMPAAIALTALSEAMERVPRELSGKSEIPLGLSNSEIAWSVARGAFAVNGGTEGLTLSAALNGSLRASAQFTGPPGFPDPRGAFMAPPRDIPGLPPGLLRPPGPYRPWPGTDASAEPGRKHVRTARRHSRPCGPDGTPDHTAGMARATESRGQGHDK